MTRTIAVVALLGVLLIAVAPASAHNAGCTPGYWKNNTVAWGPTGYTTNTTLAQAFPGINYGLYTNAGFNGNTTLLQALDLPGGSGIEGMARNLLRAAVAALLNAAHPNVLGNGNTWSTEMTDVEFVVSRTVGALNGDLGIGLGNYRQNLEYFKDLFDEANNTGCSIDAHGRLI